MAVGLSGGFDMIGYDFTSVLVNNQNDPYFGTTFNETKPNVGAGIYYYSDKHFFGISSPRLLEATSNLINLGDAKLNARHFFITGGTILKLNSVLKMQPSALIKYTPNSPITADVNLSLLMYEKLWMGIMYRFHEAMGVNPINGLRTYQSGSHELFIRFDFKPKKAVYSSPRYF